MKKYLVKMEYLLVKDFIIEAENEEAAIQLEGNIIDECVVDDAVLNDCLSVEVLEEEE